MPFRVTTHDFTHGQLDKALKSRSDMEVYKKGALDLKNVVIQAAGGARSRFGTEFLAQAIHPVAGQTNHFPAPDPTVINPDGSTASIDDHGYQMFEFAPSEEVQLLIILGQEANPAIPGSPGISNKFTFYCVKNLAVGAPIAGNFYTVTAGGWTIDNNQVIRVKYRYAQNQKNFILVCDTRRPLVLTFTGSTITAEELTFRNYPQHDFTNNAYLESRFEIVAPGTSAENVPITNPGAPPIPLQITNLVAPWAGFTLDYVGGVFQGLGPLQDTPAGGGLPAIPATPGVLGYAEIVSYSSPTQVNVRIIQPFDKSFRGPPPAGALGKQAILTEPAIGANRGWPRTVSFYESRLVFAGNSSLPQSLWMSHIGDFQDFATGTGLADEGISYTIASGQEDQILNVVSGRSLQVFTTTNEFSAPVWSEQGVTPSTITIRRQTSIGSSECIPAIIDNMTVYTKRGGRAVMAFESLNSGGNTFNSMDVSIYSSELIDNPVHMTSYVENNAYDANVLMVINKGSVEGKKKQLVMLESLREQKVAAWTTTETDGEYENVEAVGETVYFITRRNIGSSPVVYTFEKHNWNVVMDSALYCRADAPGIQQPTFENFPGLTNLPEAYWGKTLYIVGYVNDDPRHPEGVWIGTATVHPGPASDPLAGQVFVDIPQTPNPPEGPGPITALNPYFYWIGLQFEQVIQTMPVDVQTQTGSILYSRKKIFKAYVQYLESYPFFVNGVEAPLRSLSTPPLPIPSGLTLNVKEIPYSGIYMAPTMQKLNLEEDYYVGFVREATVLITQTRPLPIIIQGITSEID